MQGVDTAEAFLNDIQPWAGEYRHAMVSFCARRCVDGDRVVVARVDLRVGEGETFGAEPLILQTDRLLFTTSILPITTDSLANVVHGAIREGKLPHPIELRLSQDQSELRRTFYRYNHPMLPSGSRMPTVIVTTDGRSALLPIGELEDFDWELKAAKPPYTGIGEALDTFGLPKLQQTDDYGQLVLAAESPALIAPARRLQNNSQGYASE